MFELCLGRQNGGKEFSCPINQVEPDSHVPHPKWTILSTDLFARLGEVEVLPNSRLIQFGELEV
jgi:hypothetical protein